MNFDALRKIRKSGVGNRSCRALRSSRGVSSSSVCRRDGSSGLLLPSPIALARILASLLLITLAVSDKNGCVRAVNHRSSLKRARSPSSSTPRSQHNAAAEPEQSLIPEASGSGSSVGEAYDQRGEGYSVLQLHRDVFQLHREIHEVLSPPEKNSSGSSSSEANMLRQQSPQNTIPPPATQDRGEAFDLEQLGRDSMSHEAFSLLEKKSRSHHVGTLIPAAPPPSRRSRTQPLSELRPPPLLNLPTAKRLRSEAWQGVDERGDCWAEEEDGEYAGLWCPCSNCRARRARFHGA